MSGFGKRVSFFFGLFFALSMLLYQSFVKADGPISGSNFPDRHLDESGVWKVESQWTPNFEDQFSEWITHLFRPIKGRRNRGFKPLHQVLRNPRRNLLYNRLELGEDSINSPVHVRAVADCGDLPYQLRAYFAWKHGLPFRFRQCTRGTGRKGPKCKTAVDNLTGRYDHIDHPVARFNAFIKESISWRVHSGTMRTLPEDNTSDFYPIALSLDAIRPGTVFVDVGGHALMVTRIDGDGLWAVDGHPDKTVTLKRFSPKHFPYFPGIKTGGFKAFRPAKYRDSKVIPAPSNDIRDTFSLEQYRFSSKNQFYAHMNRVLSPND